MNKVIVGIIAVLVFGSGAFIAFGGEDEASSTTASNSQANTVTGSASEPREGVSSTPGSGLGYVDYSTENLTNAEGSKRVVFFHASWCSTCNFFEGQIESREVPSDITILKADFDRDTDLKQQYGVNVQSTFVLLDDAGEVVESWPFASGLRSIQDLYESV